MTRTCIVLSLTFALGSALAHDSYPIPCCGGNDCHPVPCDEIHPDSDGYRWHEFHWHRTQASDLLNGACHVCIVPPTQFTPARPTCIFIGGTS